MKQNKFKLFLALLIAICLLIFFYRPLLKEAFFDADDYNHHAVRTANYYLALKQGQLPVRWGPNLNQGYGYPSFNYTYHLPYIISCLFYSLGFSIQASVNLSMLSALVLALVGVFKLLLFLSKSKKLALIGSLTYVLNPLMMLNVIWRGAIGEIYFLAFVPFLFLAIELIFQVKNQKEQYFAGALLLLAVSLMIISHAPSILLLLFMLVPYLLLKLISLFKTNPKAAKKAVLITAVFSLLGILLSSWYLLPAFLEKPLIVYDSGQSLTQYKTNFIDFWALLDVFRTIQSSDKFLKVFQLGLPLIIITLLSALSLVVYKKNNKSRTYLFLFIFILATYLSNSSSNFFWHNFQLLQMVQYPWRVLWMAVFSSLYLLLELFKKLDKKYHGGLIFILFFLIIYSAFTYSGRRMMAVKSDYEWFEIGSTGTSYDEHRPIYSEMPYYFPEGAEDLIVVTVEQKEQLALIAKEDKANLEKLVTSFDDYQLSIDRFDGANIIYQVAAQQELFIIHKRLYFPGWSLKINNESQAIIRDFPHYSGLVLAKVPAGENQISIDFSQKTKVRKIAESISLFTLLLVGVGGVYLFIKNK